MVRLNQENQQGFVLISVLMIILLISSILVFVIHKVQFEKTLSTQIQHYTQMQSAAREIQTKLETMFINGKNHCSNHLCTALEMQNLPAQKIALPEQYKGLKASYTVNQLMTHQQQTVRQFWVTITDDDRSVHQFFATAQLSRVFSSSP